MRLRNCTSETVNSDNIVVEETQAIEGYFKNYKFTLNVDLKCQIDLFFNACYSKVRNILDECLSNGESLRVQFISECIMQRVNSENVSMFANTKNNRLLNSNGIQLEYTLAKQKTKTKVDEFTNNGSGWIFKGMKMLEMKISKYKPFKGASYIELPEYIKNKQACINVKNDDNQCFKWAILSAVFPVTKNPQRVSKYNESENKVNFKDIEFPTPVDQSKIFEKNNPDISINIIEYTNKCSYNILYHTEARKYKHVDLLLIHKNDKYHYVWIKDFNKLMYDQNKHKERIHFCTRCFHPCSSEETLERHLKYCDENGNQKAETVNEVIGFKNIHKMMPVPFVIYADSEAISEKVEDRTKKDKSRTL